MKFHQKLVPLLLLGFVSACAENDAVLFVTGTDLGIKLDAATQDVGIGFDRVEGVTAPVFKDGKIPAVYGQFQTDRSIFSPTIKQVHATGQAAIYASKENKPVVAGKPATVLNRTKAPKRMFFGTNTSTGLNVKFGETRPAAFSLGFKRQELSYIPLTQGVKVTTPAENEAKESNEKTWGYASVIGAIIREDKTGSVAETGVKLEQFFATGDAAEIVATYGDITEEIRKKQAELEKKEKEKTSQQSNGDRAVALPRVSTPPTAPVPPSPNARSSEPPAPNQAPVGAVIRSTN